MSTSSRGLSPENVLYLWEAVRTQKQIPANGAKVYKCLTSELEYKLEEAEDILAKAVQDGILICVPIPSGNNNSTNRAGRKSIEAKAYKIPDSDEISIDSNSHDWYCYECHTPGELHNCVNCLRSFHLSCKRVNAEKPNDTSKVTSNRRRVEPILDEETPNKSMTDIEPATGEQIEPEKENDEIINLEKEPEAEQEAQPQTEPEIEPEIDAENPSEQKPTLEEMKESVGSTKISSIPNLKSENEPDIKPVESKADVIFVGQIRPPSSRKRVPSVNYKSEKDDREEDDSTNLCTRCRLFKMSSIRDPPNINPDEVNYLLRFTFERIRSWINNDTFSPLPFSNSLPLLPKKEFELFSKICFKYPMNYDIIEEKIKSKEYSCLTEFQCDMMDLQHCMGILYGTSSAEFEATKYLLSDCSYELMEIRQCRDCYRHSNEKSTPLWFCKPCVLRHELVFAKQTGYCFWPAKVIKVKDNQYDVRFFGSNHSRAIVDGNNVKPIDTEEKVLKVKKTIGYIKAMEELQKHQELLQFPPGKFSYDAERKNPIDVSLLTSGSSIQRKHEFVQKRSDVKSPKVSATKKSISRTPQTPTKLRSSPIKPSGSPIFTIEVGCSQDLRPNAGKRKRKIHNYALLESNGRPEYEESTISDYVNSKKIKTSSGSSSEKKKGKSVPKRKSAANKSYTSTPTNKKSSTVEHDSSSKDDQISGQDSAVSSTQEITPQPKSKAGPKSKTAKSKNEKPYSEVVENLRRDLEGIKDPAVVQKVALDSFQAEVDRMQKKMNQLIQEHNKNISKIKKRQWCHHCEKEAIYYCCWNTAYCSTDCQQRHWQSEHKKTCRRTR